MNLDKSRILYYPDKIKQLFNGEKPTPITIDMALTQACSYKCIYCYSHKFQNQVKKHQITWDIAQQFLDDCAGMKVKGISIVSDGESTCNPIWTDFIKYGYDKGIDMAIGTNGYLVNREQLEKVLPCLNYFRFNVSAGEPKRYSEIHGVPIDNYFRVKWNILDAVEIKQQKKLDVDIGLQMVCMPDFKDDIIPLAQMAIDCGVDYLVIKHCSDDEDGGLGIDYSKYEELYEVFKEAESMSTEKTQIIVKWNKIKEGNKRPYKKCLAPPLHLQISGTGLVAPCGMMFGDKYSKYHIGNFCETRFKDIISSDRYWEVMDYLASDNFNAQTDCGYLCLQNLSNIVLDKIEKGEQEIKKPEGELPKIGINFI